MSTSTQRRTHLELVAGDGGVDRTTQLLERARGGSTRAWARIYQDHYAAVLRHLTYLCADPGLAEDLAQDTFAEALAKLEAFESRGSFLAWLRGIATNLARKHWRGQRRRARAMDGFDRLRQVATKLRETSPEDALIAERRADLLVAALELLPIPLREAYLLCDVEGLSAAEAAERLGISPGNARVRASRARAKIRAELAELGVLA